MSPASYKDRRFDFISGNEGYSQEVYNDLLGYPTIGYGFNLGDQANQHVFQQVLGRRDLQDVIAGRSGITPDEARKLFDASADSAESIITNRFGGAPLNENQRLALTSLAYNHPNLIGPDLTQLINAGDYAGAAAEIRNKSNKYGLKSIQARRNKEADLFALPFPETTEAV